MEQIMQIDQIQIVRKENLNKILHDKFNNNVSEFAERIGKNRYFLYGLLWGVEKTSSRKVTDKTARLIEKHLLLPLNSLDNKVMPSDYNVLDVKLVDIFKSEQNRMLSFHNNRSIFISELELSIRNINYQDIFCVRINDNSMNPLFMVDDVIFFDKTKTEFLNNKIYFICLNGSFLIRKLSKLDTKPDKILVIPINEFEGNKIIELDSINKLTILGSPAMQIKTLNF